MGQLFEGQTVACWKKVCGSRADMSAFSVTPEDRVSPRPGCLDKTVWCGEPS